MIKVIFFLLGIVTFLFGTIGVFLPGLPTTVFYLLTAFFWIKSSPKLHKRFTQSKLYQDAILKKLIKKQITNKEQIKLFISMFIIFLVPCLIFQKQWLWILLMSLYFMHLIGLSIYFNFTKIKGFFSKIDIE